MMQNIVKIFGERKLLKIAQSLKAYFANLNRCISRDVTLLKKTTTNFCDITLLLEKVELDYCKYTSNNQKSQTKIVLSEKKTQREIAIKKYKQYLDREEILSQIK